MTLRFTLANEAATEAFGADLARALRAGDRIGLVGDLGAGKTTLVRAAIRSLAGAPDLEVPSPTFTLVQDYDVRPPLRHADLYRVTADDEAAELGLGEGEAVELVEWPRTPLPAQIALGFVPGEDSARSVTVEGPDAFLGRIERARAARQFLCDHGYGAAVRRPLALDASTRRYERLETADGPCILMDAPVFTPAPNSYATMARLADGNPAAFVAVGAALREAGLAAPEIRAADLSQGFLVLTDFGDHKIAEAGLPLARRYLVTAEALAALHQAGPREAVADPCSGATHTLPRFDGDLCRVEIGVFEEWYLHAPRDPRFADLWAAAIDGLVRDDDQMTLRDVHSPNVLWRESASGIARAGLIDYQDAMIAPAAYDVVSLAQDARVTVPEALESAIVERYAALRPDLDRARFDEAYAVLGAQRATRILGVFRRLHERDNKPDYLKHLPRVRALLVRNLAHPSLADLASWYRENTDLLSEAA